MSISIAASSGVKDMPPKYTMRTLKRRKTDLLLRDASLSWKQQSKDGELNMTRTSTTAVNLLIPAPASKHNTPIKGISDERKQGLTH